MRKGRRKTMKKKPKVWEEYPPSKYRCRLDEYVKFLMMELIFDLNCPSDVVALKIKEVSEWVSSQFSDGEF